MRLRSRRVLADLSGEVGERWDLAATGPDQPLVGGWDSATRSGTATACAARRTDNSAHVPGSDAKEAVVTGAVCSPYVDLSRIPVVLHLIGSPWAWRNSVLVMARPGSGIPGASKAECWSLGRARRVSGSSRSAFCVGRRQPGGVLPAGPVRSPDRHRRCGGPGPSPTRTPLADWSDRLRSWTGRSSRSCWPSGRRGVGTTRTSTKRSPHCTAVPARRCGCDRPSPSATGRSVGSTTTATATAPSPGKQKPLDLHQRRSEGVRTSSRAWT